jgi:AraC-like DNA-binding protein
MRLTLNFLAVVYLVAVVLGIITSIVCWMYPRSKRSSIKWLGASVFSLTWTLGVFFFAESGLIFSVPHLFQTSFIATLLFMPFSYFFVRNSVLGGPVTWRDLVHAIPVALFILDYSSVYMLSAAEKLNLIETQENSTYIFQQGWFLPSYMHRPVRFMLFLIYCGLQFRLLLPSSSQEKKRLLHYVSVQFTLVIYYTMYQITLDPFIWRAVNLILSGYIVFISAGLLFRPQLLYGASASAAELNLVDRIKKIDQNEHAEHTQRREIEQICNRLEAYMLSDSPYLRHGYSIHDLSSTLEIPTYQLSAILNHYLNLSFNEYLNKYRIAYCKRRIAAGAAEKITLEALAFECGFSNRNSFTTAFKHFCSITPSEYIRLQKQTPHPAKNS